MSEIKTFLFLIILGFSSVVNAETGLNEYNRTLAKIKEPSAQSSKKTLGTIMQSLYPPYIIQHLQRRNVLFIPVTAFYSAINNKDLYGLSNSENLQYKRHSKSMFIVYPENQRPTNQPCNPDITEASTKKPYTTIPQPNTVVEDDKTESSDEHSITSPPITTPTQITTPSPITTPFIEPIDLTNYFTTPQPTTPSLPTSTDTIQPISSTSSTIETQSTMTCAFPNTTPSKDTTRTTFTTIIDKQTTTSTKKPNQLTTNTSPTWTTSIDNTPTNKTPTSTRPTITPPTIKDPAGIGKMQCNFNGLYRANNFTCDQYLVCINGITYLMDCPDGLAFNDDKKTCDWPGNVKGCNPRAFEHFECPQYKSGEENTILKFRYRESCSQFIACYKAKPRLLHCKDGFSFDEDSEDCIYFKNVTNCKNIIYPF